jgi:hypothetical protein
MQARRLVAGTLLVAAIPLVPAAFVAPGPSRRLTLAFAAACLVLAIPAVRWLWPGLDRLAGLGRVALTLATAVVAGLIALWLVITSLCGVSRVDGLLATAVLGGVYAVASAWAVARPSRALWAWPCAVLLSLTCGLVALALLEGGTRYCLT